MPRSDNSDDNNEPHREKLDEGPLHGLSLVARPVPPKEVRTNTQAQAAMDKEWKALWDMATWDAKGVSEWSAVKQDAMRKGERVHVGMVFGICVEKGAELPLGDPARKYKGRVVFQGNQVKDELGLHAVFADLGSAPVGMSASKMQDLVGLLPGCVEELADAVRAYTQARLSGTATWVRLPRDQWMRGWSDHFVDPVVPLKLALYGHPDSGSRWERHCESQLCTVGFVPIPSWPGIFTHNKLKILLTVYVDDFKVAGLASHVKEAWRLIGSVAQIEPPTPLGRYLGC